MDGTTLQGSLGKAPLRLHGLIQTEGGAIPQLAYLEYLRKVAPIRQGMMIYSLGLCTSQIFLACKGTATSWNSFCPLILLPCKN